MKDLLAKINNTGISYLKVMLPFIVLSVFMAAILSYINQPAFNGVVSVNASITYDTHKLILFLLWSNVVVLLLIANETTKNSVKELEIHWITFNIYLLISYIIFITPLTLILMAVILVFCYLAGIVLDKTELWEMLMYSFLIRNMYGVLWTVWCQECGKLKTVDK